MANERRTSGRATRRAFAVAVVICLVSVLTSFWDIPSAPLPVASADDSVVTLSVDRTTRAGMSRLSVGVTHGQLSADPWGDPAATTRAHNLLSRTSIYQNQHIMGWGASNPQPSPGKYDWKSLDRRLALIRETGGVPVITLCCAPDWMKGGTAGATDWAQLEVAPQADFYDEFAALAARVAARYPEVKHFQVWNEFKGFWDHSRNRWNHEEYTRFYNPVYRAVKAVRPDAKIGGPYPPLRPWCSGRTWGAVPGDVNYLVHPNYGAVDSRTLLAVDYWLRNAVGADFVAVDGNPKCKETGEPPANVAGATRALYRDLMGWLNQRTSLPIWWAEWYVGDNDLAQGRFTNMLHATALLTMVENGAAVALRWKPEQNGESSQAGALWTSTDDSNGGRRLPYATVQQLFHARLPAGTPLYKVTSSDPRVLALATPSHIVVVNQQAGARTLLIDGRTWTIPGYGVMAIRA